MENDTEPRYNRWHTHNQVTFYLEDFVPDYEECRILMLKVIEQVVRDYLLLEESEFINDQEAFDTAVGFIYDDEYRVNWGGLELSPEDFLGVVDIDIDWFRSEMRKRYRQKYGEHYGKEAGRKYSREDRE